MVNPLYECCREQCEQLCSRDLSSLITFRPAYQSASCTHPCVRRNPEKGLPALRQDSVPQLKAVWIMNRTETVCRRPDTGSGLLLATVRRDFRAM